MGTGGRGTSDPTEPARRPAGTLVPAKSGTVLATCRKAADGAARWQSTFRDEHGTAPARKLSLIHISEPTRLALI
eukprot:6946616-Alexandrium_andersonii.AAC.1